MEDSVDARVVSLVKNWWAIALRGLAALLFGLLTAILPGITLTALLLLFGAYALVEGVFNIVAAFRRRGGARSWWALILEGLASIAAGVITFVVPGITALALLYVIAAWAVVTGVLEIVAAVGLRKQIQGEWWLVLAGWLSIVFGVVLAIFPGAGALALVLWIGAYSLVFGILLLALAFRLRGLRGEPSGTVAHAH
jgi:uncharacterized membrane protein HdeD (DUF308 family)